MARPLFDSEFIFGIHEPGGEDHMLAAGRPGWVLFTEAVGSDPDDGRGVDFTPYSSRGLGIICRINHGYFPAGTIPQSNRYAEFAQRCANFVANSRGCKIWIIGNEMNFDIERPRGAPGPLSAPRAPLPRRQPQEAQPSSAPHKEQGEERADGGPLMRLLRWFGRAVSGGMGDAQLFSESRPASPTINADPLQHSHPDRFSALRPAPPTGEAAALPTGGAAAPMSAAAPSPVTGVEAITPALYARCYRLCRAAIHGQPGHADDQVLVGAVAPWNNQTSYAQNPRGDWVQYFRDILDLLGPAECDGMALHTYTHQADPNLIRSEAKLNPPYQDRHFEFRTYQDFMHAIPATMRHLPVYITETDQDVPWLDRNIGWVQQAYGEIDFWNRQPGNQQIRSLILYRWPPIDRWVIQGKRGVIDDFKEALQHDYRWQPPVAHFAVGDEVSTADIVNLRRTAGYRSKPDNDVLMEVAAGSRLTIVSEHPQAQDDLTWWQVRSGSGAQALTGWLAQASPAGAPLLMAVVAPETEPEKEVEKDAESEAAAELGVGARVRTVTIVRLRRSPGYLGKPADDVLADLPTDTEAGIIGGSATADGLTWWQARGVDAESQLFQGWIAQRSPSGAPLLALLGAAGISFTTPTGATSFAAGDTVKTLSMARLRRSPGYRNKPDSDIVADLVIDLRAKVTAGPQRADELTWWQVATQLPDGRSVAGWIAETAPDDVRLISKVSDAPAAKFKLGDWVRSLTIVRLRRSAGYVGKPESDILREVAQDMKLQIVGGPLVADQLTWWQVEARIGSEPTLRGWMSDSAPGGVELLARSAPEAERPAVTITGDGEFAPGQLIVAAGSVRVRRTPGYRNKPDEDTLGLFEPRTTLNIVAGPQEVDELTWWQVGGITLTIGELVGWVAENDGSGAQLIAPPSPLPGTQIPNPATGSYLALPFRGSFGISQLWGERPQVYSQFGYDGVALKGHNGIDFLTPVGTDLLAIDDCVVAEAVHDDPSGFGNYVKLRHGWGESLYAHMDQISVQAGQSLERGALLGQSGNSGFSGGPHLHFSIRIDPYLRTDGWGGFSDPLPYFNPNSIFLPPYVLAGGGPMGMSFAADLAGLDAEITGSMPGLAPDRPGLQRP